MKTITAALLISLIAALSGLSARAAEMRTIPGTELADAARGWLANELPWAKENVEIEDIEVPGDITAPGGLYRCAVTAAGGGDLSGMVSVPVGVYADGKLYKTVYARFKVKVYENVAVAVRQIERHKAIDGNDIIFQRKDVSSLSNSYIVAPDAFSGSRAKMRIANGKVITPSMIEPLPVVRRGDAVTISVESGNCSISARGIADEEGAAGDVIRVTSLDSTRKLKAVVRAAGHVTMTVAAFRPSADEDTTETAQAVPVETTQDTKQ